MVDERILCRAGIQEFWLNNNNNNKTVCSVMRHKSMFNWNVLSLSNARPKDKWMQSGKRVWKNERKMKHEPNLRALVFVVSSVIALQIFIWHNIIVWYTANLINCQLTQHILPMMMLFTIKRLINTLLMFGLSLYRILFTLYVMNVFIFSAQCPHYMQWAKWIAICDAFSQIQFYVLFHFVLWHTTFVRDIYI